MQFVNDYLRSITQLLQQIQSGVNGITRDNIGNIYIVDSNFNQNNFNGIIIPVASLISKFDSSGNLLWAKRLLIMEMI